MTRNDGDSNHRRGTGATHTMLVIPDTNVIFMFHTGNEKTASHFEELFRVGDLWCMGRVLRNVECVVDIDKEIPERYNSTFARGSSEKQGVKVDP